MSNKLNGILLFFISLLLFFYSFYFFRYFWLIKNAKCYEAKIVKILNSDKSGVVLEVKLKNKNYKIKVSGKIDELKKLTMINICEISGKIFAKQMKDFYFRMFAGTGFSGIIILYYAIFLYRKKTSIEVCEI